MQVLCCVPLFVCLVVSTRATSLTGSQCEFGSPVQGRSSVQQEFVPSLRRSREFSEVSIPELNAIASDYASATIGKPNHESPVRRCINVADFRRSNPEAAFRRSTNLAAIRNSSAERSMSESAIQNPVRWGDHVELSAQAVRNHHASPSAEPFRRFFTGVRDSVACLLFQETDERECVYRSGQWTAHVSLLGSSICIVVAGTV